ncbi:hypothetical protein AMATHDRAFT_104902, partial [Amanita thiersii Skay4041]
DGTLNVGGSLTHTVKLRVKIGDHKETMDFGISNLSKHEIFLGFDWLKFKKYHNPKVDWKESKIEF